MSVLEKETVKRGRVTPEQDAETLHAQLVALRGLSDHLVVVFDEFQRRRRCPGEPLAIIRSALMSHGSQHVSLLFTGSIRNALKMMLEDSEQPIFGEAVHKQLPPIAPADFWEYLDFSSRRPDRPRSSGSVAAGWSNSARAAGRSSICSLQSGFAVTLR